MTVLVTGGAGYIGSTVVSQLLVRGEEVVSIDNLYRGNYKYLSHYKDNPCLRMVVGDISSIRELRDSLRGVRDLSAVVHLAAVPGLERCRKDPERAVATNVLGTFNVLEVAREFDAEKVIFASSAAVYGIPKVTPIREDHPLNPINLYGATKLAGEKIVELYNYNYGLKTVVLRFGNVYGVGLFTYWETVIPKFVKLALDGKPLTIYGDGNQSRDFIHVLDVANAIMLALDHERLSGEVFNLGSGRAISIKAVANIISEVFREDYGKKVDVVYFPPRQGEPCVENFCYLTEKVKTKLGFEVKWSIREGIKQTIQYGISGRV